MSSLTTLAPGISKNPSPHITAGILSITYLETSVVVDIDLSAFLIIEIDEEREAKPVVAFLDFQLYITWAWVNFQADKASKNKGKQVWFDGIPIPA